MSPQEAHATLNRDPHNPQAQAVAFEVSFAQKDWNTALHFGFQILRRGSNPSLLLKIADIHEELQKASIAAVYVHAALKQAPQHEAAVLEARLQKLLAKFRAANPRLIEFEAKLLPATGTRTNETELRQFHQKLHQGKQKEAYTIGERQLQERRADPRLIKVWSSLALRHGSFDQAALAASACFLRDPSDWVTLTNLSDIMVQSKRAQQALDFALASVNLKPDNKVGWLNLSAAYDNTGRPWESIRASRKALELDPKNGAAWNNLGNSLKNSGEQEEALEAFGRALDIEPDNPSIWSNYLFGMLYSSRVNKDQIFKAHRKYGEYYERKTKPLTAATNKLLKRGMPTTLRVGLVSADLRGHPVSNFAEPLLTHFREQGVDLYIYDNHPTYDPVSFRLKQLVDHWTQVVDMNTDQFCDQVIKDGIHVLIDMSGHTARNRLMDFMRKPAPVQVTWLGHPYSTGSQRIDWRITDSYADPPDEDRYYTEKLWRLRTSICYMPHAKYPEQRGAARYKPNPTPALLTGSVTFGSCNNLAKLNEGVIEAWAHILKSVPGSRLLLEAPGLDQSDYVSKTQQRFMSVGIEPQRLVLIPRVSSNQYLTYHQIDIALDPFPYGGGTTTCDLLWMGVPLVTLKGERVMARAGYGFLSTIGLPELVADSVQAYQHKAIDLARDIPRLNRLRAAIRPAMQRSPLCDTSRYAAEFFGALKQMYAQAVDNYRQHEAR